MRFEEVWEQYDFTESEIISIGWEFPLSYVLKVNYYWDLTSENQPGQGATVAADDQWLSLVLQDCIRLYFDSANNIKSLALLSTDVDFIRPANFGTIVGWGVVTPSPWLEELGLTPNEWSHIFFHGANGKTEVLCRSLMVRR